MPQNGSSQHKERTTYPLFSTISNHAKLPPKAVEKDNTKELRQAPIPLGGKRGALASPISPATTTANAVVDNYGPTPDLVLPIVEAGRDSIPNIHSSSPSSRTSTFKPSLNRSTEEWIGQILEGLWAIKQSQEAAHKEAKDQLSQLNTHFTHLSTRLTQVKQTVSNLEDLGSQSELTIQRIQSELEELQIKLDELENRSR
ncbi:hypothetical protein NDU88_007512 [Pleurodeles waltl]|uniref:Uncharacterized protein n=1 Tax=Pleurodeles waltl TaxID=8319 RepID=A0AAV7VT37_PLEWA|nr:hypothetical protein NDU88_007512 [Pleurodeles waltl]